MSKYKAVLAEFDDDYHAYIGNISVMVRSWENAVKKANDFTGGGYLYSVLSVEGGDGLSKTNMQDWINSFNK